MNGGPPGLVLAPRVETGQFHSRSRTEELTAEILIRNNVVIGK